MADIKISQLKQYTPITDGVMIPCSVQVDGNWKSKAIATNDFVNYTYKGVLDHLSEGRGIDLTWNDTHTSLVVTCDLDTSVAKVVTALPESDIDDSKIYLVPITGAGEEGDTGDPQNKYAEYLYTNKGTAESPNYVWEKIGERQIETDLTGYYTKTDVDDLISDMATRTWINTSAYLTQASAAATYATKTSVEDITKTDGTIDTKISAAFEDADLGQYVTHTYAATAYATITSVTAITEENTGTIDTRISTAFTNANLSQYLTKTDAESTYATKDSISDMASKTWVGQQNYATKSEVSTATADMATQTWVNGLGYITYDYAASTYATITYAAERYLLPDGGIPKTDLASAVQTSLGLADTALQSVALNGYATESWVEGLGYLTSAKAAETYATKDDVAAKYTKPSTGIPATDLATAVQTSLGLADTAVQPDNLTIYATHDWVNDLGYITGEAAASSYATITSVTDITKDGGTIDTKIAAATKLVNYSYFDGTNDELDPETDDTFQTAISKLHKAILDNESATATSITTLNTYLGFSNDLKYAPTATALSGKNVTEAIDYLAGQVAEQSGTLDDKQDTIENLDTIISNASNGQAAYAALNPESGVTYEQLKAEVVALRAVVDAMAERLGYSKTGDTVTWTKEFLVLDDYSEDPTEAPEGE